MKYYALLFGLLITKIVSAQYDTTYTAKDSAVIRGHIKNNKADFWELNRVKYVGFETIAIPIDGQGNFSKRIRVESLYDDIGISFDDDAYATLFIGKGDTLTMNWDANAMFSSIKIEGKNTFATNFYNSILHHPIQDRLSKLEEVFSADPRLKTTNRVPDSLRLLAVQQQGARLNGSFNKEMDALLSLENKTDTMLNPLITKRMIDIYYAYAKSALRNISMSNPPSLFLTAENLAKYRRFIHPYNRNLFYSRGLFRAESEIYFECSALYRKFLYDYIRFQTPISYTETLANHERPYFNPTQKEYYLGLAVLRSYEIRDWFISSSILNGFSTYKFEDVAAVYEDFKGKIKLPYYRDTLAVFVHNVQRLKPGNPAPDFTLKDENGKSVSLSDFKGNVVYIDFWGVYCGPCIYDIRNDIPQVHKKYKDKKVVFLNVCVDADVTLWKKNLQKLNLDGVNLLDVWEDKNASPALYGVNAIPHYALIGKDGKIISPNGPRPGWQQDELFKAIDKALKD